MAGVDRDRISLLVVAGVAVALVVAAVCPHVYRFVFPLDVTFTSPVVYLPLVYRQWRLPDERIGIAEHTPLEAELLGLAGADYVSGQWRLPLPGDCRCSTIPLPGDTAVFLRPTERPHWSTWKLCSWSAANGWYDEAGCRQWVEQNPGMIYVVGNEISLDDPAFYDGCVGDGYWVDTDQYPRWYREAWELIKSEDPTAVVAPYGPVGQVAAGTLLAVWDSYREQFGTLLQADFYPVHHYCKINDGAGWCWTKLTHWISWLERHRGTHWVGPRDYWLTEWGLPAWSHPIPLEASLALMEGMIPRLLDNDIGITQSAWWPSCLEWPDCTLLIRGGQVTRLGERYLELATE